MNGRQVVIGIALEAFAPLLQAELAALERVIMAKIAQLEARQFGPAVVVPDPAPAPAPAPLRVVPPAPAVEHEVPQAPAPPETQPAAVAEISAVSYQEEKV